MICVCVRLWRVVCCGTTVRSEVFVYVVSVRSCEDPVRVEDTPYML